MVCFLVSGREEYDFGDIGVGDVVTAICSWGFVPGIFGRLGIY